MTITTVASYTPTDRAPSAFALSSPVALEINNRTRMNLMVFTGRGLRDLVYAGERRIYARLNNLAYSLTWVLVTPVDPIISLGGSIIEIKTYGNGDALPSVGSYTPGNLAPPNYTFEDNTNPTRPLKALYAVEFGVVADGVTNDGPAMRRAADVARVIGGADIYTAPGDILISDTTASSENSSVVAGVLLGSNTTIIGAGPSKTRFKQGSWTRNPKIASAPAATREFWVAKTGSDGNVGSKASPFLTIYYAVQQCTQAGGGYFIHVMPGAYSEAQIDTYTSSGQGTSTNPNIINAEIPGTVVITTTAFGAAARVFYLRQGWWVVGCEITGTPPSGGQIATCVSLDGAFSACIDCNIHDFANTSATSVTGIDVTSSAYTAQGIIIACNSIFKCGPTGLASHGIYNNGNGTIVANNLIVSQPGAGIHAFHTPSNGVVVGNTVFNCGANAGGGTILPGILVGSGDAGWTVSGFYVANNICVNNFSYGIMEFVSGGAAMGACTYTNNCEFGNASGAFLAVGGNVNANAVTSDPLFINQQTDGTGDFQLRAGSPCIDTGTDSSMPAFYGSIDFRGYGRPQGIHRDMGAYEYQAWAYPGQAIFGSYNPTSGNKDITIRECSIDGGAISAQGVGAPLAFTRTQRLTLSNVLIKNVPGGKDKGTGDAPALLFDYCSDVDISGLMIATDDGGAAGTGVMGRYSFDVTLRGVEIQGLGNGHGIFLDSCNHIRVSQPSVGGCGGHGIFVRNCQDFKLANGDTGLTAPAVAAYPYSASQNVGNAGSGVYILASTGKIVEFTSQRNTGDGYYFDSASTLDCISIQAKNNTGNGVNFNGALTTGSIRMAGVRSQANTGHGLFFATTTHPTIVHITEHISTGNSGAQLRIAGSSANAVGLTNTPATPATTVALTNPYPFDMYITITGGTVTLISLDGGGTGLVPPAVIRLRAGGTITLTYTVAPTWAWYIEN